MKCSGQDTFLIRKGTVMKIGSGEWKELIKGGLKELGIHITGKDMDMFAIHACEMLHWNKKINLTAISDPGEIAVKHFIDALAPLSMIKKDKSILDIGSGGGFPGLPLKIVMPSLNVILVDGSRKKISFLNHVIRKLKLENIQAVHIRAEEMGKDVNFKNRFDVVMSRALSSLKNFVKLALPLIIQEGTIIAMKGEIGKKEMGLLHTYLKNNFPLSDENNINYNLTLQKYLLPYTKAKRTLVRLKLTVS